MHWVSEILKHGPSARKMAGRFHKWGVPEGEQLALGKQGKANESIRIYINFVDKVNDSKTLGADRGLEAV
jgi:hypothetical protein